MCEEVIHVRPKDFFLIPDHFKTQEMCIRAVKEDPWQLKDVPDWFVVLQEMRCEDFDGAMHIKERRPKKNKLKKS